MNAWELPRRKWLAAFGMGLIAASGPVAAEPFASDFIAAG